MNTQAIEARRAYKRKWAKDHPDKVKEHQERFWKKKAAEAEQGADPPEDQSEGGGAA